MSLAGLVSMIPDWLAVTASREIAIGLSREEALRRAAVLRGLLRGGKVKPEDAVLDEDLKDVFHALIALVTAMDSQGGEALAQEANAVYQFLARVEWPDDDFGERKDLLTRCAEAGWRALGTSLAEVEKRRTETQESPHQVVHDFCADPISATVSPSDVLLPVCDRLRRDREVVPSVVAFEAARLYRLISDRGRPLGVFDEYDFFLGETAFLAGSAYRILGNRIEALRWLDRSESGFRHTVNPGVGLAEVAYDRLVVRFEMGHHEDVIELTDSLARSHVKLGDELGHVKCQLLKSKALTQVGKADRSLELLEAIRHSPALTSDPGILGYVLVDIGEHHSLAGRHPEATSCYQEAIPLLNRANRPIALAHLKAVLGETFRIQGRPDVALESYRSALADYSTLGTTSWVAYLRVLVAETLLALDRPREAEWEILQALPTIEEQKMVPEGFAAVALLRESVKRRKADPNALRELREHLQKQK